MLDASKVFDRVHYGKLFNLLRQRNLPPTITRLLLDMYTRQRLYASWNGEISDPFQTQNWVKQGGILSPILFCVYIDELLRRIDSSGLGCHIGHLSYAGVGYADDVGLLAPSAQALQKLIVSAKTLHVTIMFYLTPRKQRVCGLDPMVNRLHASLLWTVPQLCGNNA